MIECLAKSKATRPTAWLALLLATAACWLSGCTSAELAYHGLPRDIPPQWDEGFAAPDAFGHFPTLWRAWPGAEVTPENVGEVIKTPEEAKQGEDTLPPPSTEEGAGQTPGDSGMDALLPSPDMEAPTLPAPGDMPAETPLPEESMPDLPPSTEPPSTEPSAPDSLPDLPKDTEPLPDTLLPEESPPGTPPPGASSHLESLPADAPDGPLVSESSDPIRRRKGAPALLQPDEGTRRPTALRNAPLRRTSAGQPVPDAKSTDNRWQRQEPASPRGAAAAESTVVPDVQLIPAGRSTAAPLRSTSHTVESTARPASQTQFTPQHDSAQPADGWRKSGRGTGSAMIRGPQPMPRETIQRADYPTRRTSYSEPAPVVDSQPRERATMGSGNPLR